MNTDEFAPDFTLPDQSGSPRSLTGFLDTGPVVLFFYPAAMTPGCTAETCHFRDHAAEFAEIGAHRVGISPDPVDKQRKFDTTYDVGFPLLSDADGTVARQFGVRRAFGPLATKRHTFVIGTDRRVLAVIKSELRMAVHAERALEVLRSAA
ncbi:MULTISPECIES: peroxiredoxin [Prauserella salsuginis group]|uniref:thioredoxin-dependent peroxiredoxin n=2 Tax=Prauserella salsuginis group TaxID=2893672 RepID=A0A839XTU3_9PSEU|nr:MULTISPECIES: peroxiredoxin [Prauserella salsuginis group]MBB3666157.1 peroxiredoxin Q/BCP [Prauserella sediminis]MCR3722953.1 peroxiredoxin Q/BCP [Prauserella flava]MCR3737371.1 peroxiredoxin Q/BCP [Prauserella salsuginis]